MSQLDPIIAKHRRDVFLYILLPILLTGLLLTGLVLGVGILVAQDVLTMTQVRTTASVLLIIFILLPTVLLIGVIDFVILVIVWGNGQIPHYLVPALRWVRRMLLKISNLLTQGADMAAEPVIVTKATLVRWSVFLDELAHWFDEEKPANENPTGNSEPKG